MRKQNNGPQVVRKSTTPKMMSPEERRQLYIDHVKRQISQHEEHFKTNVEKLTADFAYELSWKAEDLFKDKIFIDYYKHIQKKIKEEKLDVAIKRMKDDIFMKTTSMNSTNPVDNLTVLWTDEVKKQILKDMDWHEVAKSFNLNVGVI